MAYPTATSEAKTKTSFWKKASDPVAYGPREGLEALKALNRPVVIVEDILNTGESWMAFADLLTEHGIQVVDVAALASADPTLTSAADMQRLAEKIAKGTGSPLAEVLPAVHTYFHGTFRPYFETAERAVANAHEAARLLRLITGAQSDRGGAGATQRRIAQEGSGEPQGPGHQDPALTEPSAGREPSAPAQEQPAPHDTKAGGATGISFSLKKRILESEPAKVQGTEIDIFQEPLDMPALRKKAKEWAAANLPPTVENPEIGEVIISAAGIRSTLQHNAGPDKIKSIPGIPDMLRRGVLLRSAPDKHGRPLTTHILAARMNIADSEYVGRLVVHQDANGRRFYDHELSDIKNLGKASQGRAASEMDVGRPAPSQDRETILEDIFAVNEDADTSAPDGGVSFAIKARGDKPASWDAVRTGHAWNSTKRHLPNTGQQKRNLPGLYKRGTWEQMVKRVAGWIADLPLLTDPWGHKVVVGHPQKDGAFTGDPVANRAAHLIGTKPPGAPEKDRAWHAEKMDWLWRGAGHSGICPGPRCRRQRSGIPLFSPLQRRHPHGGGGKGRNCRRSIRHHHSIW